jgi:membrane fusion protein (multidrug efflux system)
MLRAHPSPVPPRANAARTQVFLLALALAFSWGCERGGEPGAEPKEAPKSPAVRVEAVELVPELLIHQVALTGQLSAEDSVVVKSEIEGVIASVHGEEGQPVAQGDLLFRLRDGRQRARLHEAKAQLALAEDVYRRTQRLSSEDISSQAMRAEASAGREEARAKVELAEAELERTRIVAPFDGVLGSRFVSPGQRMDEEPMVELAAVDRLQLVFTVPEVSIGLARLGAQVEARVIAFPGERFPGEVFFVSPTLDSATRRLVIKAWVPNPDRRLKPGMFANVDIEIARIEGALMLPEAAMVYDRHGIYVWRVTQDLRAEKVPVEIGLRQAGRVQVLVGLAVGDRVISAGTNKVMAGKRLALEPSSRAVPTHAVEKREGETAEEAPRGSAS